MTNPGRLAFLAAYRACGNISKAARIAGVHRSMHYDWLDDPAYAADFASAHEEACDALEEEARLRAVDGWQEPVIYKGEIMYDYVRDENGEPVLDEEGYPVKAKVPLTVRKHDSNLLTFLLKAARPEKYRDNFKGEITSSLRSTVDLSNLSTEQLELLESLARAAAQPRRDRAGETEASAE